MIKYADLYDTNILGIKSILMTTKMNHKIDTGNIARVSKPITTSSGNNTFSEQYKYN